MSTVSTTQSMLGPPGLEYGSPLGGGGVQGAGEGFNLRDVIRVLKQRKISIVVVTTVMFGLSVAGTFVVQRWFPGWESLALFELNPPKEGVWDLTEGRILPQIMEQMIQTEARKLEELQLLIDVVKEPEIKGTRYYEWYEQDVMMAATGLQDDLKVAPIPDTRIIRLSLTSRDRTESRDIVRAVVDKYRKRFDQLEYTTANTELTNIKDGLDKMRHKLEQRRAEASAYRERTNSPALEMERRVSDNSMTILRAEVNALEAQTTSLQTQMDSIAGYDPDAIPLTAEQLLLVDSDPQLRYYVAQVESLDIELAVMLERLGENHRDVNLNRKRREGLYEKEVAKREELIGKVRQRQIESLRQELARAQNVLNRRQDQLEEAQVKERDLDRNLVKYSEMNDEIDLLKEQIGELERRRSEAEHKVARTDEPRLILVQQPMKAVYPSRPYLPTWIGAGFIFACACGVAFAFLRELTDQVVRTPIDVVRYGHFSVLGSIPLLDDEEADVDEIENAVRQAPHSLVAEAFRRTRTNLQFSGPAESQRALLITSPGPGDGKTAVTVNLAATLAHGGQRVLVIDCNFRRPDLGQRFSLPAGGSGLSNVLIGDGSLADHVAKTDLPNLDVLVSGPMPPTPAELLGSENMRKLLAEAMKAYDHVLLDGPPALLVSDASVLAILVDGVIVVTRADDTSKGVLKRTREGLEKTNARLVGAILNGVKARPGGYFREQYREFYDYSNDAAAPPELPEPADDEQSV